jgi:protein required for attachment to host cells
MSDTTTWVVLTDGNYIKIMFNNARGGDLKTLRDDDFEHTSIIAYKMVTRQRALTQNSAETETGYFLKLLADFLVNQLEIAAYVSLVLVGPANIVDTLQQKLPKQVTDRITATVNEDCLLYSQDTLQQKLAGKY